MATKAQKMLAIFTTVSEPEVATKQVSKHLGEQHDQKTHGRRKTGNGLSGVREAARGTDLARHRYGQIEGQMSFFTDEPYEKPKQAEYSTKIGTVKDAIPIPKDITDFSETTVEEDLEVAESIFEMDIELEDGSLVEVRVDQARGYGNTLTANGEVYLDGNYAGGFKRSLHFDSGVAHNSSFVIVEDYQGQGLGSTILRHWEDQYHQAGLHRMFVTALSTRYGSNGAYTWLRYGYQPENPAGLVSAYATQLLESLGESASAEVVIGRLAPVLDMVGAVDPDGYYDRIRGLSEEAAWQEVREINDEVEQIIFGGYYSADPLELLAVSEDFGHYLKNTNITWEGEMYTSPLFSNQYAKSATTNQAVHDVIYRWIAEDPAGLENDDPKFWSEIRAAYGKKVKKHGGSSHDQKTHGRRKHSVASFATMASLVPKAKGNAQNTKVETSKSIAAAIMEVGVADTPEKAHKIALELQDLVQENQVIYPPLALGGRATPLDGPKDHFNAETLASGVLKAWAKSSSDRYSMLLHLATLHSLGVIDNYDGVNFHNYETEFTNDRDIYLQENISGGDSAMAYDQMRERFPKAIEFVEAVVKAQYEATQQKFKEAGVTHVTVSRGMTITKQNRPSFKEALKINWGRSQNLGRTVGLLSNIDERPLSSWTADTWKAIEFAKDYGSSELGAEPVVMTAVVPVELIFSTPQTGLGSPAESEVVLLSGNYDAIVFVGDSGKPWQTSAMDIEDFVTPSKDLLVAPTNSGGVGKEDRPKASIGSILNEGNNSDWIKTLAKGKKVKKDSPTVNSVHTATAMGVKRKRLGYKKKKMQDALRKHAEHDQKTHGRRKQGALPGIDWDKYQASSEELKHIRQRTWPSDIYDLEGGATVKASIDDVVSHYELITGSGYESSDGHIVAREPDGGYLTLSESDGQVTVERTYKSAYEMLDDVDTSDMEREVERQWQEDSARSIVYHGTSAKNAESIRQDGLTAGRETRGISNASVGSAVYLTPELSITDSYSDAGQGSVFEVDLPQMIADGVITLEDLGREPKFTESEARQGIAYDFGDYDYYESTGWDGTDGRTVVLSQDIPPKYIKEL